MEKQESTYSLDKQNGNGLQEEYDALDREIIQAVKERNFKLKDEKLKVQSRIAYLLSLEKEIKNSDKKILELSKKGASDEELENEVIKQENLRYKFNISYKNDYDKVRDEVNGHRIVKGAEGYGLIDGEGKEITQEKYDSVGDINKYGLAFFKKDGKYGLINERGEVIAPNIYDRIHDFSDGFAVLEKDNKFGLMDTNGEIIFPTEYGYLSDVKNGNLLYGNERYRNIGMMNVKGEILCEPEYGWSSELLSNGYAIVVKDGMKGLLNDNGELIVPVKYNEISESDVLKGGLIGVRVYGYGKLMKGKVTLEGKEYIPPVYDDILEMGGLEGAYKVELKAKDGFKFEGLIDKEGNVIVTPDKYFEILKFETKKDGRKFAEVRKYDKNVCRKFKGLIDAGGKEVIPAVYGELAPSKKNDNIYKVSKKKFFGDYKYGYADLDGNEYFGKDAEKLKSELNLK